jgi:hypothetical protein
MCTAVSLDRQSINLLREGFQVKDKRSEETPSSSEGVLRAQHAPPSVHQVSSKQPALSLGHSHVVVFGYFNRFQRSHERWQRWMVVLKQDVELLAGVVGGHSIQR